MKRHYLTSTPFAMLALAAWPALVALHGCARVDATHDFDATANEIANSTGQAQSYRPGDDAAIELQTAEQLQRGLTVEDAVRIALLNNPSLHAAYAEIGMARADVVQSGLLSNPTFGFSMQFPEGGGRSNVQASLAQNIVDLWQIPVRRKAANRALDEAILRVARRAAQLVADVKSAYAAVTASDAALAIAIENQSVASRLLEVTLARQAAGAVGELDVNLARSPVIVAELDARRARLETQSARRTMATLLGITAPAESLKMLTLQPASSDVVLDPDAVVTLARERRLDLRAAREVVAAARARLALEYREILPDFSIGPMLERTERRAMQGRNVLADTARASIANGALTVPDIQSRAERDAERRRDISAILGPSFSLTLPIFDQNQAQIAKSEFAYEKAVAEADALDRAIVQETRQRVDYAITACGLARYFASDLVPQAEKNLHLSQETYRVGRTTLITVLDAQRMLLSARLSLVKARQDAAVGLVELERVTSCPLALVKKGDSK